MYASLYYKTEDTYCITHAVNIKISSTQNVSKRCPNMQLVARERPWVHTHLGILSSLQRNSLSNLPETSWTNYIKNGPRCPGFLDKMCLQATNS